MTQNQLPTPYYIIYEDSVMLLINRLIQEDNGDVTLHEINKLQSIERSLRKPQQVVNVGELNYD